VGPAWDRALSADGPVLIDAVTDPEVPPLPPHVRMEQAKGFAMALAHGDPASGRIVKHSIKGKLAEYITRS
jgi:pyruvate dehydrogenase (quinone)